MTMCTVYIFSAAAAQLLLAFMLEYRYQCH